MWASHTYIVPRRATPETRRWATPQDPPSVEHPSRPPLGHSRYSSSTCAPSIGILPLSVGHPCALHRAPIHPPLDTRLGVSLPCSPSGYRRPPWSLRRASPLDHSVGPLCLIYNYFHPLHYLRPFSSIFQKFHPLSRECIHFPEN
jgi:hypothetical protein